MRYTAQEVMQYVAEEDIQFIRLAFCDIFGVQKNIAIMPEELKRAFDGGIAIDASAIEGFGGALRSDLFLRPDPSTLAKLPWRPESGGVVRMFCDVLYPDGRALESDPRGILKRAVARGEAAGVSFDFGSEMEFYLFKTDETGEATREPYDRAGYMDIAPSDRGENIRREICLTLKKMGIQPESSHHEEGPGQNEIDFRYSAPLQAADNAVTFKTVVRSVAMRNGVYADFSPRPLPDAPGSGLHINISLKGGEAETLKKVMAGIMAHIDALTAFLNPTDNSYERLGKNKAPAYVTWSAENRSQLIRIPAASRNHQRLELRSADPMANPYLAFALLIEAGLDGIERDLPVPPPSDINFFDCPPEMLAEYRRLPATAEEARLAAKNSQLISRCLPSAVIEGYCKG